MFLSCVKRTGEFFGAGHVIDVLRGSQSQKVLKFEHEKLSTYGIGRDHSAKQWRHIARQLIQKNLLLYNYEQGTLKLTPKAWEVLRGKEAFFGRLEEADKKGKAFSKQRCEEPDTCDTTLFEMLRKKRKELADQANLPPYTIFHDRTLREMAGYYPQSKESLSAIYGIGRSKLEKYGDSFLTIIRDYCLAHRIPEKQRPVPAVEREPQPASPLPAGKSKRRHLIIGECFNEGRTLEQLETDFSIRRGTLLGHLYQCLCENVLLKQTDFLAHSTLTEDERQSVLSSFARQGTERLAPVFEDLNGAVSYEELKLLRLHLLCQNQSHAANTPKTFVCLALSRKYGGFCLVGKEWTDGKIGPWFRPVSSKETGELSSGDIRFANGDVPKYLDIITVETKGPADHPYQRENVLLAGERPQIRESKLSLADLPDLVDDAKSLWLTGYHSANGVNDRIPEEALLEKAEPSLYLIRPDGFTILVSDDLDGRKKVRARFSYRETMYLLAVTDPAIEKAYLMKEQGEYPLGDGKTYLTVSMSEPFNGYCYKLAAAVICSE